jgi:exonuclease VII small subunit
VNTKDDRHIYDLYITMSQTFESAYKRLQEIHNDISTQEIIDIDKLLLLQKEAKELYEYLQERLSTVGKSDDSEK